MSLYDALRAAGLDLQRAHRLDAYVRAAGDDVTDGFVRTLLGDREDVEHLRTSLAADVDALTAGLALLEAGRAGGDAHDAHDAHEAHDPTTPMMR